MLLAPRRLRQLHFSSLKEAQEGYIVEYWPPGGDLRFASLVLTFYRKTSLSQVAGTMEKEALLWLERYPIPIMVSASDDKDDTIQVGSQWNENHLMAWKRKDGGVELRWELVRDRELPDDAYSIEYLKAVYADIDYRTAEEARSSADEAARQRAREVRIWLILLVIWVALIPGSRAFLGWANPLVGLAALIYSLGKAVIEGAKILGWLRPSQRELARREEERRKEYHHYHCKRNPEGFLRLVAENFEKDERDRIQRKAEELTGVSRE